MRRARGPRKGKAAASGKAVAVRTLDEELARLAAEETGGQSEDLGRELRMSPWQWDFVIYDGGKDYRFRESFNFTRIREVLLEEAAFPFRHTLKGELSRLGGQTYVRVSFVLEEGRQFDRASAVATMNSYVIHTVPAGKFSARNLKKALAEPLRAWIRSEVRGDPSVLWDFCHERLRRGL